MKEFIIRNKQKLLAVLISLVMLAVTGITVAVLVISSVPTPPSVAIDGEGNDYNNKDRYDLPNNLIFKSSSADLENASVELQATIEPATATDKRLEWGLSWNNPNSVWATGKVVSDYVTIQVNATDSTKATITCKQAFGSHRLPPPLHSVQPLVRQSESLKLLSHTFESSTQSTELPVTAQTR